MAILMNWHTAVVGWLPDGYILAIKHQLKDREGIRLADLLLERWGDRLIVDVQGRQGTRRRPVDHERAGATRRRRAGAQGLHRPLRQPCGTEIDAANAAEVPRFEELLRVMRSG